MRATRAYIAGLGTAGSLVVGAAVVYVLVSAAVGFGGWPKVANSGAAPPQVLSAGPVGGSPVARRLAAVRIPSGAGAATRVGGREAGDPGLPGGPAARAGANRPTAAALRAPVSSGAGGGGSRPTGGGSGSTGGGSGSSGSGGSGSSPGGASGSFGGAGSVVTRVTGVVGRTVSGTGSAVGGTVKQVTGAAGGVLSNAGDVTGNAAGKAGAVAGGTVSKLGGLLGG